jgi:enoyl-CoA hydratase/carnithine racemase
MTSQAIGSATVSDLVLAEDRGAVRHLILNRPDKRNALNDELVLAIRHGFRAAADDPAVRCVVVRGAGPVFSAGMDVAALATGMGTPERLRAFRRGCIEAWNLA